jgi:hypothetical protein
MLNELIDIMIAGQGISLFQVADANPAKPIVKPRRGKPWRKLVSHP